MIYRLKRLFTVRFILTLMLLASIAYAGYSAYYKVEYWGFSFAPKSKTNVWTVEANIQYEADGNPVKISLATPESSDEFKVLVVAFVAGGYKSTKKKRAADFDL